MLRTVPTVSTANIYWNREIAAFLETLKLKVQTTIRFKVFLFKPEKQASNPVARRRRRSWEEEESASRWTVLRVHPCLFLSVSVSLLLSLHSVVSLFALAFFCLRQSHKQARWCKVRGSSSATSTTSTNTYLYEVRTRYLWTYTIDTVNWCFTHSKLLLILMLAVSSSCVINRHRSAIIVYPDEGYIQKLKPALWWWCCVWWWR